MEILPFKRLDHYISSFKRDIDGRTFYFNFGHTMATLGTCGHELVIMVPIGEVISRKADGSFDFLEVINLVFTKCTSDVGYWNIHHAKFNKQDYETISSQRRSSESTIIECGSLPLLRSALNKFSLPTDLVKNVCSSLQAMITESIKKRKEILLRLADLNLALELIKR